MTTLFSTKVQVEMKDITTDRKLSGRTSFYSSHQFQCTALYLCQVQRCCTPKIVLRQIKIVEIIFFLPFSSSYCFFFQYFRTTYFCKYYAKTKFTEYSIIFIVKAHFSMLMKYGSKCLYMTEHLSKSDILLIYSARWNIFIWILELFCFHYYHRNQQVSKAVLVIYKLYLLLQLNEMRNIGRQLLSLILSPIDWCSPMPMASKYFCTVHPSPFKMLSGRITGTRPLSESPSSQHIPNSW